MCEANNTYRYFKMKIDQLLVTLCLTCDHEKIINIIVERQEKGFQNGQNERFHLVDSVALRIGKGQQKVQIQRKRTNSDTRLSHVLFPATIDCAVGIIVSGSDHKSDTFCHSSYRIGCRTDIFA